MADYGEYNLHHTGDEVDDAVDKRPIVSPTAPTTETEGVVGGLLLVGNELYVCTDVTEGVYTWLKVKGIVNIAQTTGMLKGDGNGNAVQAVAGTDYQSALSQTQLDNIDKLNNKTIATTLGNDDTTIPTSKAVRNAFTAVGDMTKAVYDTNNNGIVDNAEKVGGKTVGDLEESISGLSNAYPTLCHNVAVNVPTSNVSYSVMCYGAGKFIAFCSADQSAANKFVYSTDGKNWTQSTLTGIAWTDVVYSGSKFVAVNSWQTQIAYSSDGVNWTTITASTSVGSVAFGNGKFVATPSSSTKKYLYSSDGVNWTSVTKNDFSTGTEITFGNGVFLANVKSSNIYYYYLSADGVTWTTASKPQSASTASVHFLNGRFILIHSDTVICESIDGAIWQKLTTSGFSTVNKRQMAFGCGKYIFGSNVTKDLFACIGLYSPQGSNYTVQGVCYGNGYFVAIWYYSSNQYFALYKA